MPAYVRCEGLLTFRFHPPPLHVLTFLVLSPCFDFRFGLLYHRLTHHQIGPGKGQNGQEDNGVLYRRCAHHFNSSFIHVYLLFSDLWDVAGGLYLMSIPPHFLSNLIV